MAERPGPAGGLRALRTHLLGAGALQGAERQVPGPLGAGGGRLSGGGAGPGAAGAATVVGARVVPPARAGGEAGYTLATALSLGRVKYSSYKGSLSGYSRYFQLDLQACEYQHGCRCCI